MPRRKKRLILGVSTGTLDDKLGRAIERGTALVSKRIKSLHELQDAGCRMFGMICPSLPQADYTAFSSAMCNALRVENCEHVWAEPMNVRGASFSKTIEALMAAGFEAEADALRRVSGKGTRGAWDNYAKQTFLAHAGEHPPREVAVSSLPFQEIASVVERAPAGRRCASRKACAGWQLSSAFFSTATTASLGFLPIVTPIRSNSELRNCRPICQDRRPRKPRERRGKS